MKVFLFLFVIFLLPASALPQDRQVNSLKILFIHAKTDQERAEACLNLDNYYRNVLFKDSIPLTRILLEGGIRTHNQYLIADALRKLLMSVDRRERVLTNDSVIQYLKQADMYLTGERRRSFITEVHLRHIRSVSDWTKDEKRTIGELTEMYADKNANGSDIYFQIERNYALGMAAALTISAIDVNSYKNASRYFDRLFELIQQVPVEYGAEILFWVNDNIYTTFLNSHQDAKVVEFLEKMMNILKQYKELPEVKKDTYQNFEFVYSLYYRGISHFPKIVGTSKARACLKKADTMFRKRGNLISLYFTYKGFYIEIEDYRNAILYQDSIIDFYQNNDVAAAEAACSGMYKEQAGCYAALKEYKKAYEKMQIYDALKEHIINAESQKMRTEMDVRYDLNHLELEKERLTSRNRQIALLFIGVIFLLSVAWGVNQRLHLNKLKRVQKKLIESNEEVLKQSEKAQESEKMKTAFINSMCHEIRTPLNAINGFSSILLDESIGAECKRDFPGLIQKNTDLLTRLLDDLLEVANLSSSMEELPLEQTDLHSICIEEMDKLKSIEGKSDIYYSLETEEGHCEIRTNVLYLSLAIAHLLNNANKFTESGKVTLGYRRTPDEHIEIRVSDTGVGIPKDKQEWVFERFTKLDSFKPGAGLGLYICKLIIKRIGGTIRIDPEYTGGTSFILTIPI